METRKRKVSDDFSYPPQQRRAACADSPALHFRASPLSLTINGDANEDLFPSISTTVSHPPSISLLDALVRQSRRRLFVHPLQWTSEHVQILGCQFVTQDWRSMLPLRGTAPKKLGRDAAAYKATRSLRSRFHIEKSRTWAIEDLGLRV